MHILGALPFAAAATSAAKNQNSMRILIIEDDRGISAPFSGDLRRQQHVVDVAEDGHAGLSLR